MDQGERFNSISHLAGAALAAIGGISLIVLAVHAGDPWKVVSFSIYAAMLLALYAASTVYHSVSGPSKQAWQKVDHCAIYLLIAGSYTPFSLVTLRGPWGWSLLGAVWGLAVAGIVQELWLARGRRALSLVIYVLMGWLALVACMPLLTALKTAGFAWLAVGGLTYTAGIGFYACEDRIRHGHGIWHLFVLAGSAIHYFTILFYIAQA